MDTGVSQLLFFCFFFFWCKYIPLLLRRCDVEDGVKLAADLFLYYLPTFF